MAPKLLKLFNQTPDSRDRAVMTSNGVIMFKMKCVTFLSRNRVSVQTTITIDPVRSLVTPESDAGGSPVVKLTSWLLLATPGQVYKTSREEIGSVTLSRLG